MNKTGLSVWPSVLTAVVALMYVWVGIAAQGWVRLLAAAGGVLIIAALVVASRSTPAAAGLLILGAVPLAGATWWSIATPVLAVVALVLGGFAIWTVARSQRGITPAITVEMLT